MIFNLTLFSENLLEGGVDAPIDAHLEWAARHIYLTEYHQQKAPVNGIARPKHGVLHVGSVAAYIPIIANLYRKHKNPDALKLTQRQLKLAQIAAIFHDSGREADGEDLWDVDSATNLFYYLTLTLKITINEAKEFAEAMANKDFKSPGEYHSLYTRKLANLDDVGSYEWYKVASANKKSIISKLIGDGDCYDIMRTRILYSSTHLNFYQEHVYSSEPGPALDDMATIVTQIRSFIHSRGDDARKTDIEKKIKYDNQPEKAFQLIVTDIKTGRIPGTDQLLRPALVALYGDGTLMSEEQLSSLVISPKQASDPIVISMMKGHVFARGIRTPAAILSKDNIKKLTIEKTDVRFEETLAGCDIRKIKRIPSIPTASGKLNKSGNRNRSCALLGWGASTYSSAGLLVLNDDIRTMHRVSQTNIATGSGKKNNIHKSSNEEIQPLFEDLLLQTKMGGSGAKSNDAPYISTHTEIVMDIHQGMITGVYYNLDTNLTNTRVAGIDGYPIHRHAPVLEAIYIQREYLAQTGILLPIYEYSGVHNFIHKRDFDNEKIIDLWCEIMEDSITRYLLRFFVNHDGMTIDTLKILSMYNSSRIFNDEPKPADSNYDATLKSDLDRKIKETIKPYEIFFYVETNNIMKVQAILTSLESLSETERAKLLNKTNAEGLTLMSAIKSIEMAALLRDKVSITQADMKRLGENLRKYVIDGKLAVVLAILSLGIDVDERSTLGDTALILAAWEGHVDMIGPLLVAGADPSIHGEHGLTALSWATRKGHIDVVKALLQSTNQTVVTPNKDGRTALSHSESMEILELLCTKITATNIDIRYLNLKMFEAARCGDFEYVVICIKAGANINAFNERGDTILTESVSGRKSKRITTLLSMGADPSIPGGIGLTPLSLAAMHDYIDVVKALVQSTDPGVVAPNKDGSTALTYLSSLEILGLLCAKITATDIDKTLLNKKMFGCASTYNCAGVERCIKAGANINALNIDGDTVLTLFAREGKFSSVTILLSMGADPSIHCKSGLTALSWAAKKGRTVTVKVLLQSTNPGVVAPNKDGSTALSDSKPLKLIEHLNSKIKATDIDKTRLNTKMFDAAKNNDFDNVVLNIKAGADINAVNNTGDTILLLFTRKGESGRIATLQSMGAHSTIPGEQDSTASVRNQNEMPSRDGLFGKNGVLSKVEQVNNIFQLNPP